MHTATAHRAFDFDRADFAALLERANVIAFQQPAWLGAFYEHLPAARDAQPLILVIERERELVGLVPLVRRHIKGLRLIESCDLGVSDYAAPVLCPSLQGVDLSRPVRKAVGTHDIVRIRPIREEHVAAWQTLLPGESIALDFAAHAVPLTAPYEDWRAAHLDRSLASQAKKKAKRWQRQHDVEVERLTDPRAIELAIRNLAKLRSGRFEGDPIQTEAVCSFYADVAVRGAEDGSAETWMVTSDREPAAILFGLTHAGRFLYLLIGADYERCGRHSPGHFLYERVIEDWMGRGGDCFDFTIGDEPFKAQFGAQPTAMSMLLAPGSLLGRIVCRLFRDRLARTEGST